METKTINLCGSGGCCPVLRLGDDFMEIGEEGNLCRLTSSEWNTLREKILCGEI